MDKKKSSKKNHYMLRIMVALVALIIQIIWIIYHINWINDIYPITTVISHFLAIILVIRIYGKHTNSAMKIPWMVFLLIFPITGLILYSLFASRISKYAVKRRFKHILGKVYRYLYDDEYILDNIKESDLDLYGQVRYISKIGRFPAYDQGKVTYYPEAKQGIEAQKEAMSKAEKFIFMEYHAIEDSISFQEIEEILVEKVRQGIDVRIVYDDVGSLVFIDKSFRKRLEEEGIKCRVFNPIGPFFNVFMNNRDHRKITVIDGKYAFTGGYNLADEYFNLVSPYGYWKDTGIKVEGRPVDSFTLMFLEMWYASKSTKKISEDIGKLINHCKEDIIQEDFISREEDHIKEEVCTKEGLVKAKDDSRRNIPSKKQNATGGDNIIIQPFAENPLKEELLAESAYMNLIKKAREYVYITSPYLLIDDNMVEELSLAAKRGIDVRIVTPGIPDKKIVYKMTRSYYGSLARNGVRIYEYMPGFIHSKQIISDDKTAIIGTINMDYRSLYHHFENGVFIHNAACIKDMRDDFENIFKASYEVTEKYASGRSTSLRIIQCLWRFVAPLV
nr:phospholipase D-like domain-containing protein [uncultured Peptostreptococcus sp.]